MRTPQSVGQQLNTFNFDASTQKSRSEGRPLRLWLPIKTSGHFPYTAAMECRRAAELFGAKTLFAEYCWRQWERIMRLPRRFAVPLSDSHATVAAAPSEQRSWKEADKNPHLRYTLTTHAERRSSPLGSNWPVQEAMEVSPNPKTGAYPFSLRHQRGTGS